jgi:hypothetical protein
MFDELLKYLKPKKDESEEERQKRLEKTPITKNIPRYEKMIKDAESGK